LAFARQGGYHGAIGISVANRKGERVMNPNGRTHFRASSRAVAIVIACAARAAIPGVLWVVLTAFAASPSQAEHWPNRILYFTHSAGYRHDVIPTSQAVLEQLGEMSRAFGITTTQDVSVFTTENLRHYAAVMFFTTGELPMSDAQKAALLAFVRSGRGFLGVHSATDTFYKWPEYRKLIGGYFNEHPWHQKVTVDVADPTSPLVGFLARSFAVDDEIYQIRDFETQTSRILLRLNPASVDLEAPNVHPQDYGWPLAWTRSYGRGRVFYTALGHEEAVWRDPRYQQMLTNAILWTMRKSH
jgi:type 1 glutamine amidotransferase